VYCIKCGNRLADAAAFCTSCGARQEPVTSVAPAAEYPSASYYTWSPTPRAAVRKRTFSPLAIGAAIAAIVIIIVIIVAVTPGSGDIPNGDYIAYAASDRISTQGSVIWFHRIGVSGNKMTIYESWGPVTTTYTGKYKIESGKLYVKLGKEDLSSLSLFYTTQGDYVVFYFQQSGNKIWLNGYEFERS